MRILKGSTAHAWAKNLDKYHQPEPFQSIINFLNSEFYDYLGIIYGLPYTGLTTLLKKAILLVESPVLFLVEEHDTIYSIRNVIDSVDEKYVFINDFTKLENADSLANSLVDGFAYRHKFLITGQHNLVFNKLINGVLLGKSIIFTTNDDILTNIKFYDYFKLAIVDNLNKLNSYIDQYTYQKPWDVDLEYFSYAVLLGETLKIFNAYDVIYDILFNKFGCNDINNKISSKVYNEIKYIFIQSQILQRNTEQSSELLYLITNSFLREGFKKEINGYIK